MLREVLTVTALLWGASLPASVANAGDEQSQYERMAHYQALPSNSLEQAITNLHSHNAHLQRLVDQGQLSDEDLVKVHELTYTLEVALERLQQSLSQTADVLEEVHLGSETMDANRVRDNAKRYLEVMEQVLGR